MQKKILLAIGLLSGTILSAQKIHLDQSFGLASAFSDISGMARFSTDSSLINSEYKLRIRQFGIVYAPRVDLLGTKNFSISITSPVLIGFTTTSRYRSIDDNGTKKDTVEGVKGLRLLFEIPLIADLNIGLRSAQDESADRKVGFYIGAGFMYSYTRLKLAAGKVTYDGFDPVVRAGIRMGRSWATRWSIGINIRGNLESNSTRMYGLQIMKEL
ncbi:MAG: hypothetical protein ABI581_10820 [Sediminibacterium sp.]